MFQERTISVNGLQLNLAHTRGDGPPLLMLHGVLRRWNDFAPMTAALAPRWQLLALDFRGHGLSQRAADGAYRVTDYVDDVVELLQTQFDEPVVLYGHSLGAMVAAAAAARASEQVRAIILEDPPMAAMGPKINQSIFHSLFVGMQRVARKGDSVEQMTAALQQLELSRPGGERAVRLGEVRDGASLRFSASCLHRVDPAVLDTIVDGTWQSGYDSEQVLSAVQCPALLLQADTLCGGMLSDEGAKQAESTMRCCVRIRMTKVGHLMHWQATEQTLAHTLNFLESLR